MKLFFVLLPLAFACPSAASDEQPLQVGQLQQTQATFSELWPDNTVVLTFDDGFELAGYTLQLARFLNNYRTGDGRPLPIPAVFFVNGCRFLDSQDPNHKPNPYGNCGGLGAAPEDELASVAAMGFELGQHTYDHVSLIDPRVDGDERVRQLVIEDEFLKRFQKSPFTFFRAPYTEWSSDQATTFNNDQRVRGLNLVGPIGFDFGGAGNTVTGQYVEGDWDCLPRGYDPKTCAQVYVDAIRKKANHSGVLLIHDHQQFVGASDKPQQMIEYILGQLPPADGHERGPDRFHYVPLGRMIAYVSDSSAPSGHVQANRRRGFPERNARRDLPLVAKRGRAEAHPGDD